MWFMILTILLPCSTLSIDPSSCITRDVFGTYAVPEKNGELPVYRYTLTAGQVTVQIIDYGATITTVTAPDRHGNIEDVVLGYDTLEGYLSPDNPVFGATIGRVANRIGNGRFVLDGTTYNLYRNVGNHSLHGGLRGFDKKLWTSRMEEGSVVMTYTSPDGEEGYPGEVNVTVTYSLTSEGTLVIAYKAFSTRRTPINLTNHAYFNLAGHASGPSALNNHTVFINADKVTETDSDFIPSGKLLPVEKTFYDLRSPTLLGEAMRRTPIDGFDYNYVLPLEREHVVVAEVVDPNSGRRLQVQTSQPGLQFYTSNSISSLKGKGGSTYIRHAAFCLEAQNFPDAINHPVEFPNVVYGPLDIYRQVIKFTFGVSSAGN